MKLITTGRLAALGLALSLPLAAQAQQEQRAPSTQAPPAAVNQARRTQHLTPEQMMQRVEAHLASLRTQLGITQAQEPQWQEFARLTRDNATAMRQRFSERGTQLAQMSAADSMMNFAQISEQNAQDRVRLATAFRALYDTMSPEQKQRADAAFRSAPQQHPHRQARGGARTGSGG